MQLKSDHFGIEMFTLTLEDLDEQIVKIRPFWD